MSPEKVIVTALEQIEGLKEKVYPVEAIKNDPPPFVFYVSKDAEEEDDLEGLTGLQSATFEVHCVAKTYASLVALSASIRSALRELQGQSVESLLIERATVRQSSPDLHEREVNLMRRAYTLQLDYQGGD